MFKKIVLFVAIAVAPMVLPSEAQARHFGAPCRSGVTYAPSRSVYPAYRSSYGTYPVYGNRYSSGYRGGVGLSIGSGGFGYPGAYRGGAFGPSFGPGFGYGGFGGFGPGLSLRIR